ncbi:hypothetical protein PSHT_05241 [Puccinia striiformis]|uniref:HAT C-terminal dimerisation domain-containing protein n=1 Tax=Puccinia striiformis TaxID=27350 RepID=A0A2S4WAY3_9BASI|nr:hypothetical protein PSHT_05241 [Puccinia striiformis]
MVENSTNVDRSQIPSTPPNTTANAPNPTGTANPPQSTRRESTRLRTPSTRPGFIPTGNDSRRALVSNTPAPRPQPQSKRRRANSTSSVDDVRVSTDPFAGIKQVAGRTGREVVVDITQDSDDKNSKVTKARSKKDPTKDKDGYEHCWLYFFPPGKGPKQDSTSLAWACRWCSKEYIVSGGSYYNLKAHRDGAMVKGTLRGACLGREKASLPWLRIEDFLLRVAFDYTANPAQLHSRVWAAAKAHQLYLEQQSQVVKEIKDSNSKISLVSDVWTTKGSHKAFIGITACYITSDWVYKCQHLAIKYVSWHHNGKYLATPFANVLVKHGLHQRISAAPYNHFYPLRIQLHSQTTDSGSNNFTMANGVAAIFRDVDSIYWDVQKNHHRCVCHVIALILGAGLRALKLSKTIEQTEVTESEIVEVFTVLNVSDEQEVDPDDAEVELPQPGWEWNDGEEENDECDESGIGWTLKKKQAEWKIWATELKHTGKGLIGGYGIRWNIAYESRQRAYEGRKVIKRLLENEDKRLAGKSAKDHYFKSYELTSKEWEEVNQLNLILKYFLDLTKSMEGDGPKLPYVLYEYSRVLNYLDKKKLASASSSLVAMFDPMIKITTKYINLAINCNTVILATFLHPAWRMMLFQKCFEAHVPRINDLILQIFKDRDAHLKSLWPETPPVDPQSDTNGDAAEVQSDSDGDEFNFYPQDSQAIEVNTELERYNNGDFPLNKEGCVLGWWKIHSKDFPVLGSLARDYLACSASSASVERTFSAAAQVCAAGRSGLAIRTIERCISSHMWLRNGVEMCGTFKDCQDAINAARHNPKFDKYKKRQMRKH